MSANPHANGGLLRKALRLPDFRDYARRRAASRAATAAENTRPLGKFLRDIMRDNMTISACSARTRTRSNKLDDIYEVSKKTWLADICRKTPTAANCRRTAGSWKCSPNTRWKAGWKAIC